MRVMLFALTGFGNKVLDSLLEESCEIIALFTRKEDGPFPYYPEENITKYAKNKRIKVYEEFEWSQVENTIRKERPDLLLVATFHKVIPERIVSLVPLFVGIHPSLLPKYRGPMPIEWTLFYKEKETGVTAHFLTKEIDAGDILIQKRIAIEKNDNRNSLRRKLAILSTQVVRELVIQIKTNSLNPVPQNKEEVTAFPKFREKGKILEAEQIVDLKKRQEFIEQYVNLRNLYLARLLTNRITLSETLQWLLESDVGVYGIIKKETLLGVIIVYFSKQGEVSIFVKEPGRGFGEKLLKIADTIAKENNLPRLWGWVRKDNLAATKVFVKNGYKKEKQNQRFYEGKKVVGHVFARSNINKNQIIRDREVERIKDAGAFPKVVLIDTVNYCNLRCSMCGRQEMTRKGGRMDTKLYQKIIDEIAEKDKTVRIWLVFFGDPFMLKDGFYSFVKYAKKRGLTDVVVNTNGNLMDKRHVYNLIKSGLDAIYVGIDAITPEVYSQLRIGGDLEKVTENVKALIRAKKELKSNKPEVFVQFVEMDKNKHEKQAFIKYWKKQGAIVKVRPKISWAGTVEAENLEVSKTRYPCYWAMRTMNILHDGRVCLCAIDYDGKFIAGDVRESSLQDVWLKGLKRIRDLHASGQFHLLPEKCRICLDWQAASAEFCT